MLADEHLSVFSSDSLEFVLFLDYFSLQNIKVDSFKHLVSYNSLNDFCKRSVTDVESVFEIADDLDSKRVTSCAEHLACIISSLESWS